SLTILFEPDAHRSMESFTFTRNHLLLVVLEDVRTVLSVLDPTAPDPSAARPLPGAPTDATVSIIGTDPDFSDEVFLVATGFLQPATLLHGTVDEGVETIKTAPGFFDTSGLRVDQHFAT